MGGWGFFDDENDNTLDFAGYVEDQVLPKRLRHTDCFDDEHPCYQEKIHYIKTHIKKVQTAIFRQIALESKQIPKSDDRRSDMLNGMLAGIAVYLARDWGSTKVPSKLPPNFPPKLKKHARLSTETQLKNLDQNVLQWKNLRKREQALLKQLKLFS